MYIYICIHICIYTYSHTRRIHRRAAGAKGSAATGPPWSLSVLPSGIYLFVFVARVSVYHTGGLFCVFVGLFGVNTGLFNLFVFVARVSECIPHWRALLRVCRPF